jgi:hypothetical protein
LLVDLISLVYKLKTKNWNQIAQCYTKNRASKTRVCLVERRRKKREVIEPKRKKDKEKENAIEDEGCCLLINMLKRNIKYSFSKIVQLTSFFTLNLFYMIKYVIYYI